MKKRFIPTQMSIYRMRLFNIDASGNRIKDHEAVKSIKKGDPSYESFNLVGGNNEYIITGNFN